MNEMFIFCEKLKIDFKLVRDLASTKWNFLNFSPGLVGGHCLPVDPYYLSYLAKKNNFNLKTIVAARKVNNYMSKFNWKIIKTTQSEEPLTECYKWYILEKIL